MEGEGWARRCGGHRAGAIVRRVHQLRARTRPLKSSGEAERRTASYLDPHSGDGWFVLHGVAVPGAVASIDHLVVTPAGVFVVESLEWSGPMSPTGGTRRIGRHLQRPEIDALRTAVQAVGEILMSVFPDLGVVPKGVVSLSGCPADESWRGRDHRCAGGPSGSAPDPGASTLRRGAGGTTCRRSGRGFGVALGPLILVGPAAPSVMVGPAGSGEGGKRADIDRAGRGPGRTRSAVDVPRWRGMADRWRRLPERGATAGRRGRSGPLLLLLRHVGSGPPQSEHGDLRDLARAGSDHGRRRIAAVGMVLPVGE